MRDKKAKDDAHDKGEVSVEQLAKDQLAKDQLAKIEEEAADWFALLQGGADINDQQKCEFHCWLQRSPHHSAVYNEISVIWEELLAIPEEVFVADLAGSERELSPLRMFFIHTVSGVKRYLRRLFMSYPLATASVSCLCLTLAALLYVFIPAPVPVSYATQKSEIRDFQLEDGSVVTLSADSQFISVMNEDRRQVSLLKGQAYFDIAPKVKNNGVKTPFEVLVKDLKINVVGTEFDVHLLDERAKVTVSEGVVDVAAVGERQAGQTLVRGQQVVAIGNRYATITEVKTVNANDAAQWRRGRLTYRDATLAEVISDARRFHEGSITLGDQSLSELRVTTSFRVDQVAEMAQMLEQILPVSVYFEPKNRILILPRNSYY